MSVSGVNGMSGVDLKYYGGKVLAKPEFVNLYVGSYWKSEEGAALKQYNDKFTKDIIKSPYAQLWKEYGAGKGTFKGSVTVGSSDPRQLTDAGIQKLLSQEIKASRLVKPTGQTVYTVFLPPGTVLYAPGGVSSLQGMGGYHGSFDMKGMPRVYYAAITDADSFNGINFNSNPKDNISIVASHEWSEVVTDPDVNNGVLGWYDERLGEVGDIPINLGMPISKVFGRVHGFAVQKEWSNKDGRSEVRPFSAKNGN